VCRGGWCLPGVLPERAMSPLRRAGAAVAPSFAWDRVRSGGSSEEKGTRLAYEAHDGSPPPLNARGPEEGPRPSWLRYEATALATESRGLRRSCIEAGSTRPPYA